MLLVERKVTGAFLVRKCVKLRLREILFACWIVASAFPAFAADEVDQMLNVENSIQKNDGKTDDVKPVVQPAELPALQPVKTVKTRPVAPLDQPKQIIKKPVKPTKSAESTSIQPIEPLKPVVLPVKNTARMVPEKNIDRKMSEPAPAIVVPPEPGVAALRLELVQRDLELAKAHKEIERLKDIVRRIQEASRRESVVLHYNKAGVYRASMMYKKAEEEYLAALAIDPNDAAVHYNLAILYDDNLKDKKKAKIHYERFLALAPDDEDVPKVREWLSSIIQ